MMKKIIVLLLLTILLTPLSAEAFGVQKTMRAIMHSWVGENINSVINHWGYPDNERTLAGRHLYYWDWVYYRGNPGYGYGAPREVCCNRILEVDSKNTVINWDWSGNNCPYTKSKLYKRWINPVVLQEEVNQKTLVKQKRNKR